MPDSYPPPVYAPAVPRDLASAPPASLLKWFFSTAALGVPAGVLWWLLSPAGALYGSGADPQTWLSRDVVLAMIELVFGLLIGALLVRHSADPGGMLKVAAGLAGCAAASVLAWQGGTLLADLLSPPPAEGAAESAAFSLMSYGVLPLWPASAALLVFGWTLGSMLRSRRR